MSIYRRIYEQHFGPIPKDVDGRTYEIHHIDGNRKNNDISNLAAHPIKKHYDIHYEQGDWAACHRIAARMKMSPELLSELSKKINRERISNKTHNFTRRKDGSSVSSDKVKNKTHNFLGGYWTKKNNSERIKSNTHNFQNQEKGVCPYCGKISRLGPLAMHVKSCERKMGD